MKLVWCPDMSSKAYIDGVKVLADRDDLAGSAELAELVCAMAGGWNAQLVVEAPDVSAASSSRPRAAATSLALAAAARRTGGRYACVLPDADSAAAYAVAGAAPSSSPTVVVGEAGEAMARLEGVDLLVVDARRRDAAAVLRAARPGPRGMVVVRHRDGRRCGPTALAAASMAAGTRVVRSVYLPIGKGVEVLHVGVGKGPSLQSRSGGRVASRWIRHVNHDTGEEHVFRRQ
ncbi:uncharacterized protein LOC133917489 [Phragmites australis]|uniref:uncharacterized protein LOC133917489 n=1 Tax=Phragmites australis TaxID=29695 RepID=UPI002D784930|nr:uncharacterized protein LOC133917489 [Phragmites australis]